ncbi:MAG: hypothetical protein KIT83_22460 [Bryobacterales bacterium]|nr:hypothetical protein [Bryobacterales bacterium]
MKRKVTPLPGERRLRDLAGVGKKTIEDFDALGVGSVAQLAKRNPQALFQKLCELKGQRIDPCCLDVFVCAVAQARNPSLPADQRNWWYWSRVRKGEIPAPE